MAKRNSWADEIDWATGRKPWRQTFKPNPLLDYDEHGRYVGMPSDILTKPELQAVEPPTRRPNELTDEWIHNDKARIESAAR
jgi:hypothetical protein